jgi:starch-binding outer membrane protein, SusD/RagB family
VEPLETSTDYLVNGSMPRTTASKVYSQVVNDLLTAETLLTASYSSSTNTRPTEMAAAALLARVYLYQKDWVNAETQASMVINSGSYNLESNLNNVFLATSGETIFQLARPANNTAEAIAFIPSSTSIKPTFAVRSSLLNAFTSGDNRKISWLNSDTISGTAYYYPYKYKQRVNNPVTEYNVVLRLAEVYLIRAEARAEQNNTNGAQADINMIRNRAGLANTTASTSATLFNAIAAERQVELFAEWGHRWLDLKRTGTIDTVIGTAKSIVWKPADALYPIPLAQIQLNPFLTQNSGY